MSEDHRLPAGQRFFRIGEVSTLAEMTVSKLRFWEQHFPELTPARGERGQRRYSRENVLLVFQIKELAAQGFSLSAISRKLETDPASGKIRTINVDELNELRNRLVALEERLGGYLRSGR